MPKAYKTFQSINFNLVVCVRAVIEDMVAYPPSLILRANSEARRSAPRFIYIDIGKNVYERLYCEFVSISILEKSPLTLFCIASFDNIDI